MRPVACAALLLALVAACVPPRAPSTAFAAQTIDVGAEWTNMPAGDEHAAVALNGGDGRELRLTAVDARGVLYGPLAFTELHLTFANPGRAHDGTFAIALPAGASVARFATRGHERWREADVVGRESARTQYGVAAKLALDTVAGTNVFRGHVADVEDEAEVVIAYTELFPSAAEYRVLLGGLPRLERLDVQLLVPTKQHAFVLHRTRTVPTNDFVRRPQPDDATAVRGGDFAVVRAVAPPPLSDSIEGVAVLVDSSASQALRYAEDVERTARIVERLGLKPVAIAAFDQEVAPLESIRAAVKRRPAGATDLRAALVWAESQQAKRAIVVTDGILTAGTDEHEAPGLDRIDVIAAHGMTRNVRPLRELAGSGRAAGAIVNSDDSVDAGARLLAAAGATMRSVIVAGATRSWPTDLSSGTTAASALAFAELPAQAPLRLVINSLPAREVERVATAPAALVERAVALGRILELERAPGHTTELLTLGLRYRLLTSQTSMLVLGGPRDHAALALPREATSAILAVGPHGVESRPRAPDIAAGPPVLPPGDADGDGIPDALDPCPLEPETKNGFEDEDGCPDAARVEVISCGITIIPKMPFKAGSAEVAADALPIADQLAEILLHHPEYLTVAVFGHADGREPNAGELSTRRANAVRDVLLQRGVDPKVLVSKGLAARYPEDPVDSDDARARNRRVEFRILLTLDGETGVEPRNEIPILTSENGKVAPRSAPHSGDFAEVMALLAKANGAGALELAEAWTRRAPGDLLAWIALGRALDLKGDLPEAARAYGSVLELHPSAEQLRAAGGFLESLAPRHPPALDLAVAAYRHAFAERPDQLASHRHLAWALAQQGHIPNALQILEAGMTHFSARLQRDVDLLSGKGPPTAILSWESEGDDLDLVAYDAQDKPTFALPDARSGFGPEALSLEKKPARLEVRSQGRGSGYAMGKVMIVTPGRTPAIETRPFVIMTPFSRIVP